MNSRTAIQLFKIISRLPVAGLQTWDWGADLKKLRDQAQCFECAFLFFWPWRRPARPRAVSAAASANPPAIRLPKQCLTYLLAEFCRLTRYTRGPCSIARFGDDLCLLRESAQKSSLLSRPDCSWI